MYYGSVAQPGRALDFYRKRCFSVLQKDIAFRSNPGVEGSNPFGAILYYLEKLLLRSSVQKLGREFLTKPL